MCDLNQPLKEAIISLFWTFFFFVSQLATTMSEFSNLLKASRFASLAKPLSRTKGKKGPTHQVVETRASSLHRQEWGVKYALPSKIKSRYITFNDVDSMERIVDFETNGGDHWKRLRFQQIGVPVSLALGNNKAKKNPLFHKEVETASDTANLSDIANVLALKDTLKAKELQALQLAYKQLRPQFLEYVKATNPVLLNKSLNKKPNEASISFAATSPEFAPLALKFITEYQAKTTENQIKSLLSKPSEYKIKGFGGLSYQLKGRLNNTPNGIQDKRVIPGRYLNQTTSKIVGIGGFTSELSSQADDQTKYILYTEGKQLRERVVPFQVTGATMDKHGNVSLISSQASSNTDIRRGSRGQSARASRASRGSSNKSARFKDLIASLDRT